ncbi:MAG: ASCH domain-containing protein [Ktedonobacteraceae bacterium]|nr:ASCH domain-containing protein [Ktedonobacteraceae bacterium]
MNGNTILFPTSLFVAILQRDVMKTLTLTQPWAQLVTLGAKRIETRSWSTEYQGPLAIHAAKSFPQWAEDLCEDEPFRSSLEDAGYPWKPGMKHNPQCLPTGQVIAVGWLEQVERITPNFPVVPIERAFGTYTPGRYAWRFSTIYRLATPIAARGSLGLWKWQPPEAFWNEIQTQYDQERASR